MKSDPSARQVLEELRSRHAETPFLALGQTVWWDEPMKAVLVRMLDELNLPGRMILGVHDTDYFAKVKVRQAGQSRFEMMPHNDGSTKDLWSAAGEISCLFGSETFPTKTDYVRHGVPFDRVARSQSEDRLDFINRVTEAWGWRGLIYTGSRDLIVSQVALSEIGEALERLLRWGFQGTADSIVDECCKREAARISDRLLQWVAAYREENPQARLTDLYQHIFPRFFTLLLGHESDRISVTSTSELLRFHPQTAGLPRFRFVDLFLNDKSRKLAADAYGSAVAGSEMYTLDRFGLGALPFDLVIPEHGRGTLRVTLRAIHIETRTPIRIPINKPIDSVQELAAILEKRFGDQVTLVGKAVALISMLAHEFLFVFNEEGSAYVRRTRCMNDHLKVAGIDFPVHPILRLRYHTWDAMAVAEASLCLPQHMSATFGRREIPCAKLAADWQRVGEQQKRQLESLKGIRAPRALLSFLNRVDLMTEYESCKSKLCPAMKEAVGIQKQVRGLYSDLEMIREAIRSTEREKGDHFRATSEWNAETNAQREEFDRTLTGLLERRRAIVGEIRVLKAERLTIERSEEILRLRARISQIELTAEAARMSLLRNAILTSRGLTHTEHRPTAWWLPMVDPSGRWFRRIAETTELYTEPLLTA